MEKDATVLSHHFIEEDKEIKKSLVTIDDILYYLFKWMKPGGPVCTTPLNKILLSTHGVYLYVSYVFRSYQRLLP
jgi:hypothetical protein